MTNQDLAQQSYAILKEIFSDSENSNTPEVAAANFAAAVAAEGKKVFIGRVSDNNAQADKRVRNLLESYGIKFVWVGVGTGILDDALYATTYTTTIKPNYPAYVKAVVKWCETCGGLGEIEPVDYGINLRLPAARCPDCYENFENNGYDMGRVVIETREEFLS